MPALDDEPDADTHNKAADVEPSAAPFARNEFVADDDGSPRLRSVRRSNPVLVAEVADVAAIAE